MAETDTPDHEAAEHIAAIAKRFRVPVNSVVIFQREGETPERIRLDELLRQLSNNEKEQLSLF